MLVRERMTPTPITITPETSVSDGLRLMREKKIQRLPVLDARGQMVGIVSDNDLLYASPSPATSLSVWEIHDLLNKLTVDKVMTRNVVTVTENTALEEAARIMADKKIGGLPVVRDSKLVGIITETDIFKVLLEMLGGRRSGVRVVFRTSGAKGTMAKVASAITGVGGNIVGMGINELTGARGGDWEFTMKVQDASKDKLLEALKSVVLEIIDVREI